MSDIYSIYFAGDLFNHKDLIGNLLLSEAIEKESSGTYLCVVPQHLEQSTNRSIDIRNSDLREIIKADLILSMNLESFYVIGNMISVVMQICHVHLII